jgi:hypothetical protein
VAAGLPYAAIAWQRFVKVGKSLFGSECSLFSSFKFPVLSILFPVPLHREFAL